MMLAQFLCLVFLLCLGPCLSIRFSLFLLWFGRYTKENSAEILSHPLGFNFTNLALGGSGVYQVKVLFSHTFIVHFYKVLSREPPYFLKFG